ncbi:MAG: hypothetical protein H0X51_08195 [Parachlamydiaceae bacterium]|nr:hypothetical protein [Parachlamydiaceae bacterium]
MIVDRVLDRFCPVARGVQDVESNVVTYYQTQCFATVEDSHWDHQPFVIVARRVRIIQAIVMIVTGISLLSVCIAIPSAVFAFSATPQHAYLYYSITSVVSAAISFVRNRQNISVCGALGAITLTAALHSYFPLSLAKVIGLVVVNLVIGVGLGVGLDGLRSRCKYNSQNSCTKVGAYVATVVGFSFFMISSVFKILAIRKVYDVAIMTFLAGGLTIVAATGFLHLCALCSNRFVLSTHIVARIQKLWNEGLDRDTVPLIRGVLKHLPPGNYTPAVPPGPDDPPGPYVQSAEERTLAQAIAFSDPTVQITDPNFRIPDQWNVVWEHWRRHKDAHLQKVICIGITGKGVNDPDFQQFQRELVGRP